MKPTRFDVTVPDEAHAKYSYSRAHAGKRMAKYEQGTAPAVLFENGEVVFAFREGKLEIRDELVRENGYELHKKLMQYGSVCLERNPINDALKG